MKACAPRSTSRILRLQRTTTDGLLPPPCSVVAPLPAAALQRGNREPEAATSHGRCGRRLGLRVASSTKPAACQDRDPAGSASWTGGSAALLVLVVQCDNAESDEFGARNALQSSGVGSEADYGESERVRAHDLQCEE